MSFKCLFFFLLEKQPESRKNIFPALFRNIFLAVKGRRRGNEVSALQPASDMDSYDPQPGPSGLQYTAVQDHTDTQSGPSSVNPTTSDTNTAHPEAEGGSVILFLSCF